MHCTFVYTYCKAIVFISWIHLDPRGIYRILTMGFRRWQRSLLHELFLSERLQNLRGRSFLSCRCSLRGPVKKSFINHKCNATFKAENERKRQQYIISRFRKQNTKAWIHVIKTSLFSLQKLVLSFLITSAD